MFLGGVKMKAGKKEVRIVLAIIAVLLIILPVSLSGCSHPFPYQGSLAGNWSGQLTVLGRNIPLGGTISITIDAKGVGSGTITLSGGGAASTKINAQVDSNGNLTGTVSFTLAGTAYASNWQGKITASGNSLNVQGTWTSDHGSGTFSGTGTSSN
jgi:hypothetical protein